ncbi:conserved hypothetical protein, putative glycosy ltransferase (GT4) [Formosa agariphila KMM 3901]|uniref:Glycosyltransferase (GT4) n=1 Tax=Formosa agariphila (strain DSM 15362 / KCTC 12365 / LMG 23005 / KMM 3901 / M-2Alg 35-1) TaxID=1347342 RepID=T2KQ49_FORAG|nr:hypothetical protein [Formosa agariphila]CDF80633.1 conserved hypothetical protein, putative glycosy ltransferase (GT4) [Formosa agariphila KMM 3901]
MNILYPICPNQENSYLLNIVDNIEGVDYELSTLSFFDKSKKYDIIHVQWPEAIFDWNIPSDNNLLELESALTHWKNIGAKIIVTKHNEFPHSKNVNQLKAYQIVYNYVDVIIHFGESNMLKSLYPNVENVIISHPLYENLPNSISKAESRKKLKISDDRFVMVCFGNFRSKEELKLTLNAFKLLKHRKKTLLTSKWPKLFSWKKEPLKRFKHELLLFRKYFDSKYRINNIDYVEEKDIQTFLNASDFVFIPRLDTLNSGNIPLAFTFKKVVVGPCIGNIGEILRTTGNPSFSPKKMNSLSSALEEAKESTILGKGDMNYEYGIEFWSIKNVAKMHSDLYFRLFEEK